MSEQVTATVRRFYAALRENELDVALETLDPEFVLDTPPLAWSRGHYEGREQAREYFASVFEHLDSPALDEEEILASGERAVAYGRMHGEVRATGRRFDVRFVHIWTVKDGKITACEGVSDSAAVGAAFAA